MGYKSIRALPLTFLSNSRFPHTHLSLFQTNWPPTEMRYTLVPLALGLGVSAIDLQKRYHECKFELNAKGGANGCIGQLEDGQCRIGGKYAPATFTLDQTTGILEDAKGRGCIITGTSHAQIQCDEGKAGEYISEAAIESNTNMARHSRLVCWCRRSPKARQLRRLCRVSRKRQRRVEYLQVYHQGPAQVRRCPHHRQL